MSKYCESTFQTKRFKTRQVMVGSVGVGGDNPVRIQSMTTSNTRDVEATIQQIIRLADSGCEIVRVTVQGMKEAEACEEIKNSLIQKGYSIPIVADIHFYPPAALRVIDFVDKVRVNPGNFADKRASFRTIEYDDISYAKEIEKIEEKLVPLIDKCKKLKRSMRIGTNHGSLSDRIMNRYGDSPKGMLESALEFARICRKNDFHDFIFSMKSSNPNVMVLSYRLLVAEMMKLGWDYPIHLGVTEAGVGEDGRIKSAIGIGSLLLDGIGDTIRVSLTEDAWNEIDPCQRLIHFAKSYEGKGVEPFDEKFRTFDAIEKRPLIYPKDLSLHRDGSVIVTVPQKELILPNLYKSLGCEGNLRQPKLQLTTSDSIILEDCNLDDQQTKKIVNDLKNIGVSTFAKNCHETNSPLLLSFREALENLKTETNKDRFSLTKNPPAKIGLIVDQETPKDWEMIEKIQPSVIFLSTTKNRLHYGRQFFDWLKLNKITIPVILSFEYQCSKEDLIIQAASECGALLLDGLGEGICIRGDYPIDFLRNLSFNILQAARMRSSKTDFISCPSCGRTLFDLQDVSKRIRERTSHLPGVKIAIMGCIVNGPGEMADADFGYVGSKPQKIDLYVGKECVEKDIDFKEADDRLIELIKKHHRWIEPALNPVEK